MICLVTEVWARSPSLVGVGTMHLNRVGIALPVVVDRVVLSSCWILAYLQVLVVEGHRNWRALDVFRPPAKNHIWLHAELEPVIEEVHRRRHGLEILSFSRLRLRGHRLRKRAAPISSIVVSCHQRSESESQTYKASCRLQRRGWVLSFRALFAGCTSPAVVKCSFHFQKQSYSDRTHRRWLCAAGFVW